MLLKRKIYGHLNCSECGSEDLYLTHDKKEGEIKNHSSNLQAVCRDCDSICWLLEEDEMGISDEFSEFLDEEMYTKAIPLSELTIKWAKKERDREEATTREEDDCCITYKYNYVNGKLHKDNTILIDLDHSCDSWVIGDIDDTWRLINDLRYIMEKLENEQRKRK